MSALRNQAVAPTEAETELAKESSRRLIPYQGENLRVQIRENGHDGQHVEIPAAAVKLLVRILSEMATGNAVTLVPVHAELTVEEAAEVLGTSQTFIRRLMEDGTIPFRECGEHRRIALRDLLEYKRKDDAERAKALDELTAEAQQLGLGY